MVNEGAWQIHLLDMGRTKYGDCLLIQAAGKTILVDGGHPGDWQGKDNFASIPDQLAKLLGSPPFKVSLLVVTHCHSDHIGCLPKLVADGALQPEWALVADEYCGFGRSRRNDDFADWQGQSLAVRQVTAGLREENHADLSDADLAQFLADAATLEAKYRDMLKKLEATIPGRLIRYLGEDTEDLRKLEQAFKRLHLRVVGPSTKQLLTCAEAITQANRDADVLQVVKDSLADDPNPVALYRSLASRITDAEDRPGKGAALNDQSIVFSLAVGNVTALFTGDMQFARPEIAGLGEEMDKLKAAVADDGPFQFVKIAHHGSYNALDAAVMDQLSAQTSLYAISGGIDDPGHPDPSVLQLLKKRKVHWTRTDRNGLISVTFKGAGAPEVSIDRGRADDPTPNARDVAAPEAAKRAPEPPRPPAPRPISPVPVRPIPPAPSLGSAAEVVEVHTKVPHVRTSVRVTIEVLPGGQDAPITPVVPPKPINGPSDISPLLPPPKLGAGRSLPPLLFVTSREGLARNLGQEEATQALKLITDAGQPVFDGLPPNLETAADALPAVRQALAAFPDAQGVVLLGGYDVIPPQVQDVLDPPLRTALRGNTTDSDNFIVWSDSPYGDVDGQGGRIVPVTRIPDGKAPDLVMAALTAGRPDGNPVILDRFGIRNSARPFAEEIYSPLPGARKLLVSGAAEATDVKSADINPANHLYFMLHGDHRNATQFWGEGDGEYPVAFEITNVPERLAGVVFTGCCWGALAAEPRASRYEPGRLAPRTPDNSLALRFLRAGALAFIGCTGSHYSPTEPPYNYYGGPMHRAFWRQYVENRLPPAQALLEAKKEYLAGIPHKPGEDLTLAIEMKIFRQYTCLGLGW